jgi:phosphoglycolate phosphatase-like HAD superfamily hydrolase
VAPSRAVLFDLDGTLADTAADLRDVEAARAAGMRPIAVEWGYTSPDNAAPRD